MNISVLKLRKLVATFSVATLLASLLVVPAMAAVPAQFTWAEDAAMAYGDESKFNELGNIMNKCEFSKIVASALGLEETMPTPYPFTDVADWAKGYVGALYTAEIVEGRTATFFGCSEAVTRAEMVVILDRAYNWASTVTTPATLTAAQEAEFTNVMWAKDAFRRAMTLGVVTGYAGGVLDPARGSVKAEGFVVAYRAAGSPEVEGDDETPGRDTSFDDNGDTEGSIDDVSVGSPDETEALEGEEEVEIYALDFELTDDGPLQLQRTDVVFGKSNDGSLKPWDYFTEVSVAVDGEIVATMDASSSDDWSDKLDYDLGLAGSNDYRLRFTGLEETLVSDDVTTVSVLVSMQDNLDTADQAGTWEVAVTEVRVMDETGVVTTENYVTDGTPDTADYADTFSLDGEDTAVLEFSDAEETVDATVVEVSETSDTTDLVVYSFEIEETEGVTATIEEMTAVFATTGAENTVIKSARLAVDGDPIGADETVDASGDVTFDNLGLEIEADSTVTVDVMVTLRDRGTDDLAPRYAEGTTLAVSGFVIVDAEDDNDNDETEMSIDEAEVLALESETHELRTEGVRFEFVSASATAASPIDGESQQGEFEIKFTATSFGDDFVLADNGDCDTLTRTITGGTAPTDTCSLDSTTTDSEDVSGDTFELDKNSSRTFIVNVVVTPDETGFYKVTVDEFTWGATTGLENTYNFDMTDYKTGSKSLTYVAP
jgi:hypothetical protein